MPLTLKFQDTFTGVDGTAISARAPDLDVPAGGWTTWNGAAVITGNRAESNNGSSGNRSNCGPFTGIDYDVHATIDAAASGKFPGVGARHPANNSAAGIEFTYALTTTLWELSDNTTGANSVSLVDATVVLPALIKLECRGATVTGYYWNGAAWVQKLQITAAATDSTRRYASLLLGNGSGVAANSFADNFEVYEYTVGGGATVAKSVLAFHMNNG